MHHRYMFQDGRMRRNTCYVYRAHYIIYNAHAPYFRRIRPYGVTSGCQRRRVYDADGRMRRDDIARVMNLIIPHLNH